MPTFNQCRLCGASINRTFVDLGMSPLCESYVPEDKLDEAEVFYPLHVRLCDACLLVQLPAYVPGEDIFSDYAYFSSYSDSWVAHAKRYADEMTARLGLTDGSLVTEVASNDGYLLQHFHATGIPVLGVEPAANVAKAAQAKGIRTVVHFLGPETGAAIAAEYGRADLVAGNNVFAHVPDIRGFAAGLRVLLRVGHPRVGVRGKVCVVREDIFAGHISGKLNEQACIAKADAERIEHFWRVKLVLGNVAFAKRRHPEIDESSGQRCAAQSALMKCRHRIKDLTIPRRSTTRLILGVWLKDLRLENEGVYGRACVPGLPGIGRSPRSGSWPAASQ